MKNNTTPQTILVTGGAGYVGAALVPKLLNAGHTVRVIDWYIFGRDVLAADADNPNLQQFQGDIRDQSLLREALQDCDAVIHLACISNDPSFELDPALGRSVNFDAFQPLVDASIEAGVQRFIYASSSSVYGVSEQPNVDESHELNPLTDYSKFKAMCEPILLEKQSPNFTPVVIRPATVCGYSTRQRLDLTVNILTNHAIHNGIIKVFGGTQKRPNIHIADITDLYVQLLDESPQRIAGGVYNAGYQNHTVRQIADIVRDVVTGMHAGPSGKPIEIVTTPTDDLRSYHISSGKIREELGFQPKRTIEDAVRDLVTAFQAGKLPDAMDDPRYFNIKTMQQRNPIAPAA